MSKRLRNNRDVADNRRGGGGGAFHEHAALKTFVCGTALSLTATVKFRFLRNCRVQFRMQKLRRANQRKKKGKRKEKERKRGREEEERRNAVPAPTKF